MAELLRVLLVTDAVGGVWDFSLCLAGDLLEREAAAVRLLVVGPPPDEARLSGACAIPRLEIECLDGRLEWMEGGHDWLETLRAGVARRAASWQAGIVHVNQLGLASAGCEAAWPGPAPRPPVVLGVHSDVVTWWRWVKGGGRPSSTLPGYLSWQRDLAQAAFRQADVVVCPSAFLAGELARCYALERAPRVIHNAAVEPDMGRVDRRPTRQRHLAVVVGRAWDEAKNLGLVAAALQRCETPWEVEVAGDIEEPGRPSVAPPAAPGLRYLGFLDKRRLADLYARATVCIAPSSYEPFGLAAVEAALAGCAVVANDLPSYREVWGEAARYFRRNDAGALARLLDSLYDRQEEIERLAAAARQRAATRYRPQRMIEGYACLYRDLTQRACGDSALSGQGGPRLALRAVLPLGSV